MAFDIIGARKGGYTDDEIAEYLAQKHGFDFYGAVRDGHKTPEILSHLLSKEDVGTPEDNRTTFERVKDFARDAVLPVPAAAYAHTKEGMGGLLRQAGELTGVDALTRTGSEMVDDAKAVQGQILAEHGTDPNDWTTATRNALTSVYQQAPFMAVGGLAAAPTAVRSVLGRQAAGEMTEAAAKQAIKGMTRRAAAVSLAPMGGIEAGSAYNELREKGNDPVTSMLGGTASGAVEVGTEMLPTSKLFEIMTPAAKWSLKTLTKQLGQLYGQEMVGESLATFLQDSIQKVLSRPNMTNQERLSEWNNYLFSGEALQNFKNTLKSTAIQTTLMGGGAGVVRHVATPADQFTAQQPQAQTAPVPQAEAAPPVEPVQETPTPPSGPLEKAVSKAEGLVVPLAPVVEPAAETTAQPVKPAEELLLDEARTWAADAIKQGNTSLMRQVGEGQQAYDRRVLDTYRKKGTVPVPLAADNGMTPQAQQQLSTQPAVTAQPAEEVIGNEEALAKAIADSANQGTGVMGMAPGSEVIRQKSERYARMAGLSMDGWDDADRAEFVQDWERFAASRGVAAEDPALARKSVDEQVAPTTEGAPNGNQQEQPAASPGESAVAAETLPVPAMPGIREQQGNRVPVLRDGTGTAAKNRRALDVTRDSLIVAVAKLGGVDRAEIDKQMGNGREVAATLNKAASKEAGTFLHTVHTKGLPLDAMREKLVEQGYLPQGSDMNALLERLDAASRGKTTHSTAADFEAQADRRMQAEEQKREEEQQYEVSQVRKEVGGQAGEVPAVRGEAVEFTDRETEQLNRFTRLKEKANAAGDVAKVEMLDEEIAEVYKLANERKTAEKLTSKNDLKTVFEKEAIPEPAPENDRNTIFTKEKADRARAILRQKLSQLNAGLDPEMIQAGIDLAGYHIESGARSFAAYSKKMIEDLGEAIKPFLKSFYLAVRNYPGFDNTGMETEAQVESHLAEQSNTAPEAVLEWWRTSADRKVVQATGIGLKPWHTLLKSDQQRLEQYYAQNVAKQPATSSTTEPAPILSIVYNQEHNGIELHFNGKPDADTIARMKNMGFRWSMKQKIWYAKDSPIRRQFAERLQGKAAEEGTPVTSQLPTVSSGDTIYNETTIEDGGDTNAVTRTAAAETEAVADDRAGDEGSGAADVPADEGSGEPAAVSRRPGRAAAGKLRGSVRAEESADSRAEGSEGPSGERAGADDGAKRSVARRPADMAGVQRPADHRIQPGDLKRVGGWKTVAERNLDILELVKRLDAEKRPATPEEQALLAKFTGWGAGEIRNNLFPGVASNGRLYPSWAKPEWQVLVERVEKLFTPEELKTAVRSTQYAHYTSEQVVRSIYGAVERFGFTGGKVFEPGMGTGNFQGLMPAAMHDASKYTGIEFDHLTAAIARHLYPRQNIIQGDFVKQRFPNDFFDMAIGNPPFAQTTILDDPDYKKYRFSLHDYFFAKTIDKVRPGGLLVFVTSRYTMDKQNDKARGYLADRADLLGAIRLPQTAFKENAGAEVVTDVLFLRKREEGQAEGGKQWQGLGEVESPEGPALINEYFASHPEMVLGRHSLKSGQYGSDTYTVLPYDGDIEEQFAEAVKRLPKNVYSIAAMPAAEQKRVVFERDFNPKNRKEGGLYLSDKNEIMSVESGSGVPLQTRAEKLTPKDAAWLRDYIGLRDAVKQAQYDQLTEGAWEKSLKELNRVYDRFVEKNGRIGEYSTYERKQTDDEGNEQVFEYRRNKNEKLLRLDVESPLVDALERVTEDGGIVKGPFLLDRTIKKPGRPEVKTIPDALAVTLDELGRLDLDHVAGMVQLSREEVIDSLGELIYAEPGKSWLLADEYLSGDVVKKLEEAEEAARLDERYRRNVEALLKVQPKPLTARDVTVALGSTWIKPEVVSEFADDVLGIPVRVEYSSQVNHWRVANAPQGSSYSRKKKTSGTQGLRASGEWGTSDRGPNEILAAVLNNTTLRVTRTERIDGTTRTWVDEAATAAVNDKAKNMRSRFSAWVWEDAERAGELLETYNRRYNNIAPRRFDGSHLTLPGVSLRFKLHPHQKRAIWRVVQTGNTYLAHAVGAGKTIEMIAAGIEMRRLGLIKKPLYVVPKHMLQQFANEFLELYPLANIMVADEENFHTSNRRRFMAQAALNDPDAIVITHPSLAKLSLKPENIAEVRNEFISALRDAVDEMDEDTDKFLIRRTEQRIEQAERRFDSMTGGEKADKALTFEELGVDFLFVDEAHEFRKLDFVTNRQVKGIDPNGSQKALDLYMKTRWLEKQNPGRSHVFASGTPVTNTIGELYSLMRFFIEKEMERDGIEHFDAWSNMFGQVAPGFERNAAGRYEIVERFAKFVNVPELMNRVRTFMDVLTSSQLGAFVTRPDVKGGKPEIVVTPQSAALKGYLKNVLEERIKRSRDWKPTKDQPGNPDPIINIITDGRLASIDMRFVGSSANDPDSKLNRLIDGIIASYKEGKGKAYTGADGKPEAVKGAAQIVFFNHGFGAGVTENRGFDARAWVNKRLKDAKIPASEVAWIDDYDTAPKKEGMFKEVRQGKKRILIGSAKRMGTGVNVQKRLLDLHYLDAPWYPADVEQPHGRIIRQGNQNKEIAIKWYATEGSYDSTMWQMVARKGKFIEQALAGDNAVRSLEDISEASQYEVASALAAGDDRVIQLAGLNADIERLSRLREAHAQEPYNLRGERNTLEWNIDWQGKRVAALEVAEKKIGGYVSKVSATVGGQSFAERKDIGAALIPAYNDAVAKLTAKKPKEWVREKIATVNGQYAVYAEANSLTANMTLEITEGVRPNIVELTPMLDVNTDPVGLVNRITNKLNGVGRELIEARATVRDSQDRLKMVVKRFGAPFEYVQELAEKVAEAARLEAELAEEGKEQPQTAAAPPDDGTVKFSLNQSPGTITGDSGIGDVTVTPAQSLPFIKRVLDTENLQQVTVKGGNVDALRKVAKLFNKTIVFFQEDNGASPDDNDRSEKSAERGSAAGRGPDASVQPGINGFVLPDRSQYVFLNVNASNHLLYILGHELNHTLKAEDPQLWQKMAKELQPLVRRWSEYRNELTGPYARLSEQEQAEELFGDVMGHHFLNDLFWNDLAQTSETLFRKIARKAVEIINKALKLLVGVDVRRYISDLEQSRAVIARTLAQYAEKAPAYARYAGQKDDAYLEKRLEGYDILKRLQEQGITSEQLQRVFDMLPAPAKFSLDLSRQAVAERIDGTPWGDVIRNMTDLKRFLNPLDWSNGKTWFDDWTPEAVKSAFGSVFMTPHFQAERDPAKSVFVETGEQREVDRVQLLLNFLGYEPGRDDTRTTKERVMDALFKWNSGQSMTRWEDMNREVSALDKDQFKAFEALVVEGDVMGRAYTSLQKALLNPRIARFKPSAGTFELYSRVRSHIDIYVRDERIKAMERMMEEAGIDKARIDKTVGDYRNELRDVTGWMTRYHGEGDKRVAVYHVIDPKTLMNDWTAKKLYDTEGKEKGEQLFLGYFPGNDILATVENLAQELGLKATTTANGKVVVTNNSGTLNAFRTALDAKLQDMPPVHVMVFSRYHTTMGAARRHARLVAQDFKKAMPHNFIAGRTYETDVRTVDRITEELHQVMKSDFAVEAALEQTAKKALQRGEMSRQEYDKFMADLVQDTAEVLMGRAAGRYQIRRAPYLIEGYDTENVMGLYQDYMTGVAGMLTKADYARRQFKNYRETKSVEVKPWAAKYIFDNLRNMGLADRIGANLRSFASFMYMGWKPASALINATQPYTIGFAELGRHMKGGSPLLMIAKSQQDVLRDKLSYEEQEIFRSAIYKEQEMNTAMSELTGHGETAVGKGSKFLHTLTGKSLAIFQRVEVLNRKTMILSAYRILRDKSIPAGKIDEAALRQAMEINRSSNFGGGRENLPGFAHNPLGRVFYSLQQFTWGTFNWLYNRATSGEKADMEAILRYTAAIGVLGGLAAITGGDEADKLYRKLFGKSIKLEMQQWLRKHLKEYGTIGEALDVFIWHGLPGVAGVNISNSLRVQIPIASQWLADKTMTESVTGVMGGLVQKGMMTGEYLSRGMVGRALESAAPEAIAGPMRAYRMANEGVTTSHGKPVFDEKGKPVKYTPAEAALRTAGLQPLEQSERTEVTMTARALKAEWNERRSDLLDALRAAGNDPQKRRQVVQKIMRFNLDLNGSQVKGLVLPIKAETIRKALAFRPDKKQMRFMQGMG